MSYSIWRGGLVPIVNDRYIIGVDTKYQTLIDLGGHRELSDRDIIDTMRREAYEESLGIVNISRDELIGSNPKVLTYDSMILALVPMEGNWDEIHQEFHRRLQNETNPESNDLVALTPDQLVHAVVYNDPPMYWRTRALLAPLAGIDPDTIPRN